MKNMELYERLALAHDEAYEKFHEQLSLSTTLCELGRGAHLRRRGGGHPAPHRAHSFRADSNHVVWRWDFFVSRKNAAIASFTTAAFPNDSSEEPRIECNYTSIMDSYLSTFVRESRVMSLDDLRRETSPFVPITSALPHEANYCVFAPLVVKQVTVGFLVIAVEDDSQIQDNQLAFINGAAYQTALAFETAHPVRIDQGAAESITPALESNHHGPGAGAQTPRARIARRHRTNLQRHEAARRIDGRQTRRPARHPRASTSLKKLAAQGMDDLRHISLNLRPPMLDDLGLIPTLNWFAKDYTSRFNIKATVQVDLTMDEFDPDFETNLFRIIQEAHDQRGQTLQGIERSYPPAGTGRPPRGAHFRQRRRV